MKFLNPQGATFLVERRLLLVLMVGWAIGALNAGLVSGTLTAIRMDLSLTPEQSGIILSSWLVGMLVGASLIGYLSDRFGRRSAMVLSLAIMGIFTPLSSFSRDWLTLAVLRLLSGTGNTGYMVTASVLLAEYSRRGTRGMNITLLESAWAVGWLFAVILSRILLPVYGWRAVFLSSLATWPVLLVMALCVPESIRFLLLKGRTAEAQVLAERYSVELPSIGEPRKVSLGELFSGKYAPRTLMLWIHWFMLAFSYWGIFTWLPDLLARRGLSIVKSLEYAIVITLAQIPGYFSAAYLVERVGRKRTLAVYMLVAGLSSFGLWAALSDLEVLLWGIILSAFNLGAWGVTYAYTPELYPTSFRGTASGWANSIGRIGGIAGPYFVGLMLSLFKEPFTSFIAFALAQLVSCFVVLTLGIETKGKTLEEISQ
jgi:putative MFS transporter